MPRMIIKRRAQPRKAIIVKKKRTKRSYPIYYGKYARMRALASRGSDYGKVRETFVLQQAAGGVRFFFTQLADLAFDRAQTVAQAFQEFRIKYVKLTFRPNYDTYQAGAPGTAIVPQLYFMYNKSNSIPTNANAGTFASMGARPYRMDDYNLVRAWKPTVINAPMTAAGAVVASQILTSPWLSTNANSGNPAAAWAPSTVDHLGCAFYITNSVVADAQVYNIDVEVLFEFRKPNWKIAEGEAPAP